MGARGAAQQYSAYVLPEPVFDVFERASTMAGA